MWRLSSGVRLGWVIAVFVSCAAFAADPMVDSVSYAVRGNEFITLVDVSFTLSDGDGDNCYVSLFGHDVVTLAHYPMRTFIEGDIYSQPFTPGSHRVTWIATADRELDSAVINSSNFVLYVQVSDAGRVAPGGYCVIDVSGGTEASTYPVDYPEYVDVTLDKYKTDHIVLRELPDGDWAGVYEITQRQYELVTGATPSSFGGNPMRPVEQVSWDDITGSGGYASGFIATLRSKTGLSGVDLPTSEAWEYTCRAGTTHYYNDYTQNTGFGASDETTLGRLGWYDGNSGSHTHDAGEQQANAWGLYDMHGNVWEWTLTVAGSARVRRGGSWVNGADYCRSGLVNDYDPGSRSSFIGFRLAWPAVPGQAGGSLQGQAGSGSGTVVVAAVADHDGDGTSDLRQDFDGDGAPDAFEDFDGDGTPDAFEDGNENGTPDAFEDGNENGTPDAFEDFDGDGTPDAFEDGNENGTPDAFGDANSNDVPDGFEDGNENDVPDWYEDGDGDDYPDGFRSVATVFSPSHPNAEHWYVNAEAEVEWEDYAAGNGGYLWLIDQNANTSVSLDNGTHTTVRVVTQTDLSPGIWYFHVVGVDGSYAPLAETLLHKPLKVAGPAGPAVSSSTHPDPTLNYAATNVSLSWTDPGSSARYYFAFDASPDTIPTTASDSTAGLSKVYVGVAEGAHWFHVRAEDYLGGLTEAAHFRVNVISGAPEGEGEGIVEVEGEEGEGMTEGEVAEGEVAEGEGEVAEGEVAEGEVAEGEVTEGEVTEGEVTEGEVTEGEVTEGEVTEGEVTEGEVTEGEVTEGEVAEGEVTEGEVTEGEVTEGEVTEGEVTEGEVAEGEVTEGEVAEGEVAEGEVAEGEVAEGEVAEGEEGECADCEVVLWMPRRNVALDGCALLPIMVSSESGAAPAGISLDVSYDPALIDPETVEILPTGLTGQTSFTVNKPSAGLVKIISVGTLQAPRGDGHFFDFSGCFAGPSEGTCTAVRFERAAFYESSEVSIPVDASDEGGVCVAANEALGDLTGDGVVDAADVLRALEYAVGEKTVTESARQSGDFNGDNLLDSADAVMIQRYAVGLAVHPEARDTETGAVDPGLLSVLIAGREKVTVSASIETITEGDTAEVAVMVSDPVGLCGYDFTLSFPAKSLGVTGVREGTVTGSYPQEWHGGAGFVNVSMGRKESITAEKAGEGVLAYVTFQLLSAPADGESIAIRVEDSVQLKGQFGESFTWYTTVLRTHGGITVDYPAVDEDTARTLLQEGFSGADADQSGGLSIDEARDIAPGLTEAVFEALDVNRDGEISLAELQGTGGDDKCGSPAKRARDYFSDILLFGVSLGALFLSRRGWAGRARG